MPILLLLAGLVILAGVVAVALGRGGEMAEFATDYLAPEIATAADVAMLRPPATLWGYNAQLTDEALNQIAQVISERDVEIAVLRQQLAELRSATGSHPAIAATLLARSRAAGAAAGSRADAAGLAPGGSQPGPGCGRPGPGGSPAGPRIMGQVTGRRMMRCQVPGPWEPGEPVLGQRRPDLAQQRPNLAQRTPGRRRMP